MFSKIWRQLFGAAANFLLASLPHVRALLLVDYGQ